MYLFVCSSLRRKPRSISRRILEYTEINLLVCPIYLIKVGLQGHATPRGDVALMSHKLFV